MVGATTYPADISKTVELVCDFRKSRGNDCPIKGNEENGEVDAQQHGCKFGAGRIDFGAACDLFKSSSFIIVGNLGGLLVVGGWDLVWLGRGFFVGSHIDVCRKCE